MSYGIMGYMISVKEIQAIWGSKIALKKNNAYAEIREKIGAHVDMAPYLATDWLKKYNKTIKAEYGYPDFRAHTAIQDIFDGELSYPNAPFIYTTLLEAISDKLAKCYYFKILEEYKQDNPFVPKGRKKIKRNKKYPPDEAYWAACKDHMYNRVLLRSGLKSCMLPNDQWYPCDLSIIDSLPNQLPIPIPEPEEFPFISVIENDELETVIKKIAFTKYSDEAEVQMRRWFEVAKKEGRDLIFFIY